jgi:hypothetical protein
MKKLLEKIQFYSIIIGAISLIMLIVNLIKRKPIYIKNSLIIFGVCAILTLLLLAVDKLIEKKEAEAARLKKNVPPPVIVNQATLPVSSKPTVLGVVVLIRNPLRFAADQPALIKSILDQQVSEFGRAVDPSAKVQVIVPGSSINDEAYIYGVCRSAFEGLGAPIQNNEEFLKRVAVGSFTASDGNYGKHYSYLDRTL